MFFDASSNNPNDTISAVVPDTIDTVWVIVEPHADVTPFIEQTWHHGGYDLTLFVPTIVGMN